MNDRIVRVLVDEITVQMQAAPDLRRLEALRAKAEQHAAAINESELRLINSAYTRRREWLEGKEGEG